MTRFCIDPGTDKSAWCQIHTWSDELPTLWDKGYEGNAELLERIGEWSAERASFDLLLIEGVASYGRQVGKDVFDTCIWIGRFLEAAGGGRVLYRPDICHTLTGTRGAPKSHVWVAVRNLYGGDRKAYGAKCPACKGRGWRGRGRPKCEDCSGLGWEEPKGKLHELARAGEHIRDAFFVGLAHYRGLKGDTW